MIEQIYDKLNNTYKFYTSLYIYILHAYLPFQRDTT